MDHLWIINGSYGGCEDKIVGTGEIFRRCQEHTMIVMYLHLELVW